MIALLWLVLALLAGRRWLGLLLGDPADLLQRTDASPWPATLFRWSASLWMGLLPLTVATYALAGLLNGILPADIHPLLVANAVIMPAVFIWLIWPYLSRAIAGLRGQVSKLRRTAWASLMRSLQDRATLIWLLPIVLWLLLGLLIMVGTFYRDGTFYHASYSVFSDFAPHTALVSSFSEGRNWPTEYPHFANDGISYHFLFFFLCGNLNFLGVPLDWAINLPSILGLLTFCVLLGLFAVQLTGRRAAYLLAPLLLFCRSSLAFFTFVGDLIGQYGFNVPAILNAMLTQDAFIGKTVNDSWGLWGVNVYANQRHLLPGLSIALIVLFLFLPDLRDGLKRHPSIRRLLISREFWRVRDAGGWRRLAAALILVLLLPYFHGAALIALLLILAGMAIFSTNRSAFLILAVGVLASTLLQSWIFSGDVTSVVHPKILTGFIAPDKSIDGILAYLLEMSGLLLPLVALIFWLPGRRRKIMIASFLLPLVFALTVSLTPDVTVNHKFIIIAFAFCNIYVADLLIRLWSAQRETVLDTPRRPVGLALRRTAAVLLATVLMITGVQEIIILRNISQKTVTIDSASPLAIWIEENTAPDAVFVTAPYHYNSFYLSGRATWLGHSYYAWSAGHDTATRFRLEQWLLTGCGDNLEAFHELIAQQKLDYLIIDDTLREHAEFTVDEAFFAENFAVVAHFPQLGNMVVFDLRSNPT